MSDEGQEKRGRATARHWIEFSALRLMVGVVRGLPRNLSRSAGAGIGALAFRLLGRLRATGFRNLELAFPEKTDLERKEILRGEYRNLGHQLAEFCQMSSYTPDVGRSLIRYDGLDNYLTARDEGKGVLVLTGHLGAWELSSFHHSLMGYPMGLVIRRLDNPLVDEFVNRIRCQHGNRVIHKDDFARGLIASMRTGETVGILMDTNMTPPQGVFVPFFGQLACTASGMARVALKTGAAVVPGFLVWDTSERQYILKFGERIKLVETGDPDQDAIANTARFAAVIEGYVRQYPDQWLWMHRRWKTRPPGEERLY